MDMEKDITVREFVDKYSDMKTDKQKEAMLSSVKVQNYIGYSTKCALAKQIVESTSYDKEQNKVFFNTPLQYVIYVHTLINAYTNLQFTFNEDDIMNDFDDLDDLSANKNSGNYNSSQTISQSQGGDNTVDSHLLETYNYVEQNEKVEKKQHDDKVFNV